MYNCFTTYEENYKGAQLKDVKVPTRNIQSPPPYKLLDFRVHSLFGISAGLLLNSKWIEAYSQWGFDILTYKTVRTQYHKSYPPPNCIPVNTNGSIVPIDYSETMLSSFGIPSQVPKEWQRDVQKAKQCLSEGQVLTVSVVGSSIDDFVKCAQMAKDAGADIVELNFSCPNINITQGNLYTNYRLSAKVSKAVKKVVQMPVFVKIGHYKEEKGLRRFLHTNAPYIDGVVSMNSLKINGLSLFRDGRDSGGMSGKGIKGISLSQARLMVVLKKEKKYDFCIVGVGGALCPEDIVEYMDAGVDAVQSCTGAMLYPQLAYSFHTYKKNAKK